MRQHIVHDPASVAYSDGLEAVWSDWEPALRSTERMLHGGASQLLADHEEPVELLRRAQYRAHTASEFAAGLRPPLPAVDAHDYLVSVLGACRDTLGVLAVRAELGELDEQSTEIGLHSVSATREAFQSARYSSVAAHHFTESMEPMYVPEAESGTRGYGTILWALVAICAVLFAVLLFEIFLLTPPA